MGARAYVFFARSPEAPRHALSRGNSGSVVVMRDAGDQITTVLDCAALRRGCACFFWPANRPPGPQPVNISASANNQKVLPSSDPHMMPVTALS